MQQGGANNIGFEVLKLKREIIKFCNFLSNSPTTRGDGAQLDVSEAELKMDWRPYISEPYTGKWMNEWPYEMYERAVQLLRELNEENVPQIAQRYKDLKREFRQLRDEPKNLYSGGTTVGREYERAFNKRYYYH